MTILPWCILGDSNDLLYSYYKIGCNVHPQALFDGFQLAVEDSGLIEVDITGEKFTLERSRGTLEWVRERLVQAFDNEEW